MPRPIHRDDGDYALLVHGHIVIDLNVDDGQSDLWVRNRHAHLGGSYTLSIDHGPVTAHVLNAGAATNYDSFGAPTHYHVTNTGAVALEVSIS